MPELKTGFARLDITPPLGTSISGYYHERLASGILDPLYASAVVFDDGENRGVVFSVDNEGICQFIADGMRARIAKSIDTAAEAVFIACTHTHLGAETANLEGNEIRHPDYMEWLTKKLCDAAELALADAAPTKMLYTHSSVEDVAFVRRFRMKNGEVRTNPQQLDPNIDHALGEPDEEATLLILKRQGKPEIGIINFQVHPDVIGGTLFSADYPKFVRDTYEKNIENSYCMYINGAQGDTNHIDVRIPEEECGGYGRSEYMGKKIAYSVLSNYYLAKELRGTKVSFGIKSLMVKYNKGKPEEIEKALRIHERYLECGDEYKTVPEAEGMRCIELVAEAERIVRLIDYPEEKELKLSAIAVGEAVFAGFPGEPFTDIGRAIKTDSKFKLTIPACCTNGYEGYYPMKSAFAEGGYEAMTAQYAPDTADEIIDTSAWLINSL